MQLISYLVQRYFGTPTESFTAKVISAVAVFKAMTDYDKKDYEELIWIRENTHADLMVPLYVLDRNVNPTKGDFKIIQHKFKFRRNDYIKRENQDKDTHIETTDDRIQYYLCLAEERIEQLICRNIKDYGEEIKLKMGEESEGEGLDFT